MKLSFSRRTKRQTEECYTVVKTGMPDVQWELYKALFSASLTPSFYQPDGGSLPIPRECQELICQNETAFLGKLAIYLRESLHKKALSFIVSAELASLYGDSEWISHLIDRLLPQAGEIPEWLEYYAQATREKAGPKPGREVLKGLSMAFNRLDEYQFTRCTREEQLKLKKALGLVRPKGRDKAQRILFGKIAKDRLPARTTWQQEWKAVQQQPYDNHELQQAALRDKWKEGISSFRMGYAALLDHLPRILTAGVSGKVLKLAAEYLGNVYAVADSRLSPYRFPAIYRKLQVIDQGGAPLLMEALEQAVRHSARNLAGFEENSCTVIAMDVSNSMRHPIHEGDPLQRFDIAPLLAMLLKSSRRQVITGIIGNTWKPIDFPTQRILAEMDSFHRREGEVGYAINAHLVIQDLLRKGLIVDKVMIFTDCNLWESRVFHQPAGTDLSRIWKLYRQMAPAAKLYLFNLAGYGNKPLEVGKDGVFLVSGWNERIFGVLKAVEKEGDAMEEVHNTTL
jgi:60 kDa SS-A/Ro ribonucleoprotein